MRYFISGHRDITKEEFEKYYVPRIDQILQNDQNCSFVVGECVGVDTMAQDYLASKNIMRVTVYHMFESPRHLASVCFSTKGGYKDDVSRDAAMTEASDIDIAFIRKGRWTSGTAQNILRRYEF